MTVTVNIPEPLRKLANGQVELNVEIANTTTVEKLIDDLESKYTGIKNKLFDNGEIRGYVKVFVNDEDINFIRGKATEVKRGDTVTIVAAIAGG
ncbi:MAG: MoaD/ThiS family protein [Gammaproteobacteria bacterium]|nr:MoaD/ThiS family protein [Gammaproteobacteria bacterium]